MSKVAFRAAFFVSALALVGAYAEPAAAHRDGKAEPRISAQARGTGYNRTLIVRLTDLDSRKPIRGAAVLMRPTMTRPHVMSLLPRAIPEARPPGTYRLQYTFIMPGDWKAKIEVSGVNVISASAELPVPIAYRAAPAANQPRDLPTRLETKVTSRDWLTMTVLWLHGLAALGWIVGVIVMAVALSTSPLLERGLRARVATAYRRWGAWVHWAAVPVIVGTGIYNMVYVTPFELALTPDAIRRLDDIAYGRTYEAILLVKLALFVVLLGSGTAVLLRTLKREVEPAPRSFFSSLGASGIVYILTVPAILAAAMALRYVHILSHVGEVVNT